MTSAITDVPSEVLDGARLKTLEVLEHPKTVEVVAKYYEIESDYAGALYLGIPDPDPSAITAADLFSVSSLSITIPTRAARRLLLEPAGADAVNDALHALPDTELAAAADGDLVLMRDFYCALKDALRRAGATKPSGAWVTASKIAARKRPRLFPVRDTLVTTLLGTRKKADYYTDWIVFRHLMRDEAVASNLRRLREALEGLATSGEHLTESEPLRLLDVALWTHMKK